jgi:hypothetical protein
MEARVSKLEGSIEEIRATLARLEPAINRLATDCAETKGRLPGLATAADVALLNGRVQSLPNVWQTVLINAATVLAIMLAFAGVLRAAGLFKS